MALIKKDETLMKAWRLLDLFLCLSMAYCVFWSIIRTSIFSEMITGFGFGKIYDACEIYLVFIGLVKIFINIDSKRKEALVALGIVVFVLACRKLGLCDYYYYVVPIIAFFGEEFDKLVKVSLPISGITLFVVVISSLVGIIPNYVENTSRVINNIHALGFYHHNTAMGFYLFFMLSFFYVLKNRKIISVFCMMHTFLIVILYGWTGSNAATTVGLLFLILFWGNSIMAPRVKRKSWLQLQNLICMIMVCAPIIVIFIDIFGLFLASKYGNTIFNQTMMNRFLNPYRALVNLGLIKSEKMIENAGVYNNVSFNVFLGLGKGAYPGSEALDNEYFNLFINDGLLILVPYVFFQILVLLELFKRKKYTLMLMCDIVIIYGMMESLAISFFACGVFSWLIFSNDIIGDVSPESENR